MINKNNNNEQNELHGITPRKVIKEFARAVFISVLITILNYSFLVENVIENLFFSILTSSVVASIYYHLFLGISYFIICNIDNAIKKKPQVILSIVTFILFYMFVYFLQLWSDTAFHLVILET